MIFGLPFHIARFFRPTLLAVFDLSNADLGDIFAVYGITAMLAYFPGGAMADRFSARRLMSVSLLATAIGGFYLAQFPGRLGLFVLFAYWGMTSILLFWAALIKATREWGGTATQGRAFGLLDGGRGLIAATIATVAVFVLSTVLPTELHGVAAQQRRDALRYVIYFYTLMTLLAAALVWYCVPDSNHRSAHSIKNTFSGIAQVIKKPFVWLQAIIVVCAYCGYKGLDNYALYAVDVLQLNELDAAQFVALAAYLRPLAAVTAGFLADRFSPSRVIATGFGVLLFCYLVLAMTTPGTSAWFSVTVIYANLILSFCAVFAVRGVYFALLEQTRLSSRLTGTAVGLISVIGFTPDIFFAPLAGRLLDAAPGIAGHQHFFIVLFVFSAIGIFATMLLGKIKSDATKQVNVQQNR